MNHTASPSTPIHVQVVGLPPIVLTGVGAALEKSGAYRVSYLESQPVGMPLEAERERPDIVVADIEYGLRLLKERRPNSPYTLSKRSAVFIISGHGGERDVRVALEAGVHGYASLGLSLDQLHEGVTIVAAGHRYLCPRTAQRLADSLTTEALTQRENDVLSELSRGICNKTIANRLNVSTGTVKAHVKALMSKLDAKTRTEVLAVAISRGLIDPWSIDNGAIKKIVTTNQRNWSGSPASFSVLSLAN